MVKSIDYIHTCIHTYIRLFQ